MTFARTLGHPVFHLWSDMEMYENLTDLEFVRHICTGEDRLDRHYVEEAKRRRESVVVLLAEILTQEENYGLDRPGFWGVVHAVHLLGILADERCLDSLFVASAFSCTYSIDWIWEALPECYLRLGLSAVPRLIEYIERNRSKESDLASVELDALMNFWEAYPAERPRIEQFLEDILRRPGNDPEFNADLIAELARIGRADLKPVFLDMFDRGDVDLEILSCDDVDYFLKKDTTRPGHRLDLEAFYSQEEIDKRQERWKKEEARAKQEAFEAGLLRNYKRTGRNDKCPCGSDKKFKKCHLPWVEQELMRMRNEEERESMLLENVGAVVSERKSEVKIRRFLAKKSQTSLFPLIRKKVVEAVTASHEEFGRKGFSGYFQDVISSVEFKDQGEAREFMVVLQEYFNALAHQYDGHQGKAHVLQ